MLHSIPKYADITQSLIEFLALHVEAMQPAAARARYALCSTRLRTTKGSHLMFVWIALLRAVVRVENAFKRVVARGVIAYVDCFPVLYLSLPL
jgi:hypothetical protein